MENERRCSRAAISSVRTAMLADQLQSMWIGGVGEKTPILVSSNIMAKMVKISVQIQRSQCRTWAAFGYLVWKLRSRERSGAGVKRPELQDAFRKL
jgi:hypothetical protein